MATKDGRAAERLGLRAAAEQFTALGVAADQIIVSLNGQDDTERQTAALVAERDRVRGEVEASRADLAGLAAEIAATKTLLADERAKTETQRQATAQAEQDHGDLLAKAAEAQRVLADFRERLARDAVAR